jgi:hypothetical protein
MIQSALCCGRVRRMSVRVYPYRPTEPWVPWIVNLTRFRIMRFVLTSCASIEELIYPWIKTLRKHGEYIPGLPVRLSRRRTLAVCITIMNAELRDCLPRFEQQSPYNRAR